LFFTKEYMTFTLIELQADCRWSMKKATLAIISALYLFLFNFVCIIGVAKATILKSPKMLIKWHANYFTSWTTSKYNDSLKNNIDLHKIPWH